MPATAVRNGTDSVAGPGEKISLIWRWTNVCVRSSPGTSPSKISWISASLIRSPAVSGRLMPGLSRSPPTYVPLVLPRSSSTQCSVFWSLSLARSRRACTPDSGENGSDSSRSARRPIRIWPTPSSKSMERSAAAGVDLLPLLRLREGAGRTRSLRGMSAESALYARYARSVPGRIAPIRCPLRANGSGSRDRKTSRVRRRRAA